MSLHRISFHGLNLFLFNALCVDGWTFTWWTNLTLTWLFLLSIRACFLAALSAFMWGVRLSFNDDIWLDIQLLILESPFTRYVRVWSFCSYPLLWFKRGTLASVSFIAFLISLINNCGLFIQTLLIFFANISQCLKILGLESFCPDLINFCSYISLSLLSLFTIRHAQFQNRLFLCK